MIFSSSTKVLLVASAMAGLALAVGSSASSAAPASGCAAYARDVADANAPRYHGFIGGLIRLPFDVTGALVTGHTAGDFRWKQAYDVAYSDCLGGRRVAAIAVKPGSAGWLEYCAAKHPSFDPRTGTYVTYSGEVVPCR